MAKNAKGKEVVKDGSEINIVAAPKAGKRGRPKGSKNKTKTPVTPTLVSVTVPAQVSNPPKILSSQRTEQHNEEVAQRKALQKKVIGEQDRRDLEEHRGGGVTLLEVVANTMKTEKITIEIQGSKADRPISFPIRKDTPFTCTKHEYEILNAKIEGGLKILGEIHSATENKRESHRAEAMTESLRLKKLYQKKIKDGTIQSDTNKNEDSVADLFSGQDDEALILGEMDSLPQLKRALGIAQSHGSDNLARKIMKRIGEVSNNPVSA